MDVQKLLFPDAHFDFILDKGIEIYTHYCSSCNTHAYAPIIQISTGTMDAIFVLNKHIFF